jgi:hypothetical protein
MMAWCELSVPRRLLHEYFGKDKLVNEALTKLLASQFEELMVEACKGARVYKCTEHLVAIWKVNHLSSKIKELFNEMSFIRRWDTNQLIEQKEYDTLLKDTPYEIWMIHLTSYWELKKRSDTEAISNRLRSVTSEHHVRELIHLLINRKRQLEIDEDHDDSRSLVKSRVSFE